MCKPSKLPLFFQRQKFLVRVAEGEREKGRIAIPNRLLLNLVSIKAFVTSSAIHQDKRVTLVG